MKNKWIFILCFLSFEMFSQQTSFQFDFGGSRTEEGFMKISENSEFDYQTGFGFIDISNLKSFDRGGNAIDGDFITSEKPFYFSVVLPEGNYDVKLILGDTEGESESTIRVENRRLMINDLKTNFGQIIEKTITVHVKDSLIRDRNGNEIGVVNLKPREKKYFHWDNLFTIEFNDKTPKIAAMTITPNHSAPTIYLTGDSTVVDQLNEPWASWGQMLPYFFVPEKIVIANYAESGETLKAFENRHRIDKIWNKIKPGDYLFIQFAHNDQKSGNSIESGYRNRLKDWISKTRNLGAIPVLVTSMNRRSFDESGKILNTLDDYPNAVREIATDEKVNLIDLNAMSKILFESMGVENSQKAFVHYPENAYPHQPEALADNTHFNPYGAYLLAKSVVKSIVEQGLPLARFVSDNYQTFDLQKPDPIASFHWPESIFMESTKPDGN